MRLACTNVGISFGPNVVLKNATFTVDPGSFVCVLGTNGAGKSSLLRALAGLHPCSGHITFDGRELQDIPRRERAKLIAYLPQDHEAHWPVTVRDLVMLGRMPHLSSLARPSPDDIAAVDNALARVDAVALADRPVTELSGGERARVLLARALSVDAPVLLVDEPIAALDPRHQIEMMELFRREAAERGRIIIAAVHDLSLASRLATRLLVISGRAIIADGTPLDVLTPELVARVFGVDIVVAERDGLRTVLPWSASVGGTG